MPQLTFLCPGCFTDQALYPNVTAPAPQTGVWVICPDCNAVALHHAHPSVAEMTRTWASICAEVDVQMFRRQLDRGVSA